MIREEISIADAKIHFSELINKVVYGHEEIVITKRRKPVAVISAPETKSAGLASAQGWLEENDIFFKEMEQISEDRHLKKLRVSVPEQN